MDVTRFTAAVHDVPGQAAWRARIGAPYILTASRHAPDDGCLDLLGAHAMLVQEHAELTDVHLVLAFGAGGGGAHGEALERSGVEPGTAPILLDAVAEAELPALVAGAPAFGFFPTRAASHERAVQALPAGVPVVARDLPELRAVLRDVVVYGDTALSIADALVDVLTDPPEPGPGIALARSLAGRSEDGVVEEQPDRGDGRQD